MRALAAAIVLAPALAHAGGALPFIRDDGDSFVEGRFAIGGMGGPGIEQTSTSLDVSAQYLLGTFGVYGAVGGAHVHERDPEENPGPPPHYDEWSAWKPIGLELGGLARLHGDHDTALTLSAGVAVPSGRGQDSFYAGNAYTELAEHDSARVEDAWMMRTGVTASVRGGNLIAAVHAGLDLGGAFPRAGAAIVLGGHGGGTSITLAVGGYHSIGSEIRAGAFALALGVAQRVGRAELSLTAMIGASAEMDGGGALVGGLRWEL